MSTDEQDAIIGRMIRERSEVQKSVAALREDLKAKARSMAELVSAIEGLVNGEARPAYISDPTNDHTQHAISKLQSAPEKEAILQSLHQFNGASKRLLDLKNNLAEFGA